MRYWKSRKIPGNPRIGIGVASFLNEDARRLAAFRALAASIQAQTYPHWQMLVVHDGKVLDAKVWETVRWLTQDPRISFIETKHRAMKAGHPHRQLALNRLLPTSQWVMLTNDDNLYAPIFLEALLHTAVGAGPSKNACGFVHCDFIHSHKLWKFVATEPQYRKLDLGGFLVKSEYAKHVPFDNFEFNGDGDWINRLVTTVGRSRIRKVGAALYVHN